MAPWHPHGRSTAERLANPGVPVHGTTYLQGNEAPGNNKYGSKDGSHVGGDAAVARLHRAQYGKQARREARRNGGSPRGIAERTARSRRGLVRRRVDDGDASVGLLEAAFFFFPSLLSLLWWRLRGWGENPNGDKGVYIDQPRLGGW